MRGKRVVVVDLVGVSFSTGITGFYKYVVVAIKKYRRDCPRDVRAQIMEFAGNGVTREIARSDIHPDL